MPASRITEKDFSRQVLDIARIYGWTVYHPFLSKWSERGFPDLTLVKPPRLIFAELKTDKGKVSADQERWIGLLRDCGVDAYIWRPAMIEHIALVLGA